MPEGRLDEPPDPANHFVGNAQLVELEQAGRLVEQAHDHGFAVLDGHGRQAHIDVALLHAHAEAAVLRQALLADVERGHELQACDERRGHPPSLDDLLLQLAVHTLANTQNVLVGFDVNIGGADLNGILEH
jgi:hypothetical protein